jgi:cysteine desulfurase
MHFERGLEPMAGAFVNGAGALRAPHITNVSLPGRRAESLALALDLQGIAVGTGSACASGAIEASHVLAAMGQNRETARAALRVSVGVQNTLAEIDALLAALARLAKRKLEL